MTSGSGSTRLARAASRRAGIRSAVAWGRSCVAPSGWMTVSMGAAQQSPEHPAGETAACSPRRSTSSFSACRVSPAPTERLHEPTATMKVRPRWARLWAWPSSSKYDEPSAVRGPSIVGNLSSGAEEFNTCSRSRILTRPRGWWSTSMTGAIEQLNAQSNGSRVVEPSAVVPGALTPSRRSTSARHSSPPLIRHDTPVQTRTTRFPGSLSRNSG